MKRGVLFGLAAYLIWGAFPLFFPLLQPASAGEILAHRVFWSFVLMALVLAVLRQWKTLRNLSLRVWSQVGLAAVLIAINWGVYIYAVNNGHVVEAALGYFMNPLVSVALGVLVLKEKLRPLQWIAIVVAIVAVVILALEAGRVPWLSLALAFSFGMYGFIKKVIPLRATQSLTAESMVLSPLAVAFLIVLQVNGTSTLTTEGPWHVALLVSCGVVTIVPLVAFGVAAPLLPLSTMGFLQYLTPTLQFLLGVLVFREDMPGTRWAGFAVIWLALVIYSVDAARQGRGRKTAIGSADRTVPAGESQHRGVVDTGEDPQR